ELLVRGADGHAAERPPVQLSADVPQRRRRARDGRGAGGRRLRGDPRPLLRPAVLSDIVGWDCTLFQYIGELCRYLLQTAPHPQETAHRIRTCCGNGLRPDVWTRFQDRFRLPQILEFYAATEGNVSLVNVEGRPGAIGRIPKFLAHRLPAVLVQYDVDAGAPVRDARGCCVRCAPHE